MSRKYLNINQITITQATQMRDSLLESAIEEYTEVLLSGNELTPINVIQDQDQYYVTDGYHRMGAHIRANKDTIPCFIKPGTLRDAILAAAQANGFHGVKRTIKDKRKAVNALLNDDEWKQWSDAQIAKACCVSDRFVAQQRKLTPNVRGEVNGITYINKHGQESTMKKPKKFETSRSLLDLDKGPTIETVDVIEEYDPRDDEISELKSYVKDQEHEIHSLKEVIALGRFDGTKEEKEEIKQTIEILRKENELLSQEVDAVKNSRNFLMNEKSEVLKQLKYWKKKFEKTEKFLNDNELYKELQETRNQLKRAKFIISKHGIDVVAEGGL